jgi:hypothetical protein
MKKGCSSQLNPSSLRKKKEEKLKPKIEENNKDYGWSNKF